MGNPQCLKPSIELLSRSLYTPPCPPRSPLSSPTSCHHNGTSVTLTRTDVKQSNPVPTASAVTPVLWLDLSQKDFCSSFYRSRRQRLAR